uniref:Putative secreted salivary gland peptide n=1 Tax=Ixodes ricinus TaxID=34613 RepID=A0A147BRL7_IXORI
MLRLVTLLLAASTFGNGAAVNDFNDHVDEAVGGHQPSVIRNKRSLHLEARIPSHEFQVESNGLFNHDLDVTLTDGAVRGLDDVTRRLRNCVRPTCLVDLRGLVVSYIAQTQGDDSDSDETLKHIWVKVTVTSAEALFNMNDIRARQASLNSLVIGPISVSISYDNYLDLNSGRHKEFVDEVARYTRSELRKILRGSYLAALQETFADQ